MRIDLTGKRVLGTGGNSDLGTATVRAFGAAGARVANNYVVAPEDFANSAVVLASNVANYVTATTVFVDGGITDYPGFMHGG